MNAEKDKRFVDTDWIDYLKESGNYESYDGLCDCYKCREIREGYYKWKEDKKT
jgi:hypothetical protein